MFSAEDYQSLYDYMTNELGIHESRHPYVDLDHIKDESSSFRIEGDVTIQLLQEIIFRARAKINFKGSERARLGEYLEGLKLEL